MANLPVERWERQWGPFALKHGGGTLLGLPSLPNDRRYLHMLLDAVAWLLSGVVNTLPFLQEVGNRKTIILGPGLEWGVWEGWVQDWLFLFWCRCWWYPAGQLCSCRSWEVQSILSRSAPPCGSPSSARMLGSHTEGEIKYTTLVRFYMFKVDVPDVFAEPLLVLRGPRWWSPRPLDSDPRQWRQSYKPCERAKTCPHRCVSLCLQTKAACVCLGTTWVWTGSAPLRVPSVWARCSRPSRCCSPQTSGDQSKG